MTLHDIARAQAIALAFLADLQQDPYALFDLEGHPAPVQRVFEETGQLLTDGRSGAPTDEDVCYALTHLHAHIYDARAKRSQLILTLDASLHKELYADVHLTRADAKAAAKLVGAAPHNYLP